MSRWLRPCLKRLTDILRLLPFLQDSKFFISMLILLVIGLHALPVLQGLRGKKQTFWPIMSWSMYRGSYSPDRPVQTTIRRTIAITSTGQEFNTESVFTKPKQAVLNIFPVQSADVSDGLGLNYFAFARFYLRPMWNGDIAAAQGLAERLSRGRQEPIVEFRLESEIYTVSPGGIIKTFSPPLSYRVMN